MSIDICCRWRSLYACTLWYSCTGCPRCCGMWLPLMGMLSSYWHCHPQYRLRMCSGRPRKFYLHYRSNPGCMGTIPQDHRIDCPWGCRTDSWRCLRHCRWDMYRNNPHRHRKLYSKNSTRSGIHKLSPPAPVAVQWYSNLCSHCWWGLCIGNIGYCIGSSTLL